MADYIVKLAVTFSRDVDAQELQGSLNQPDVKKRLGDVLSRVLVLPEVQKKYPESGTFAVGSVTVVKKDSKTGVYHRDLGLDE